MKKTSIRYNNNFLLSDGENYYITDITELDEWKQIKQPMKSEDVTNKIKEFINQHQFSQQVNYIDSQQGG